MASAAGSILFGIIVTQVNESAGPAALVGAAWPRNQRNKSVMMTAMASKPSARRALDESFMLAGLQEEARRGLQQALLLTGSPTVGEFKKKPKVLTGELKDWL